MHGPDHPVGQVGIHLTVFISPAQDLVVDIGNVAHVVYVVPAMPQIPSHHVKRHQHPGMPQMAIVVDSHAAHVHTNLARLQGFERFLLLCQRIVDTHYLPPLPQESRSVTVRLNTGLPDFSVSSWSQKKYPSRSNWYGRSVRG